ncbi:hypothetical protein HHI36_009596 [Cryptolaemus montrouzieri]|uniref:RanBD1 domain-containing protein n=1 Tax=Cryptolaemus montrouzieri TaxID=559131 RepID=A0ABD2MG82_9CUCU
MAGKRSATSDLNHDNWDQEDTPEDAGSFNRASDEILKKRVFKTAKRRITKSSEGGSLNVFNPANLAKFSAKTPSQPSNDLFGFLSKGETDVSKTNGISEKSNDKGDGDKFKTTAMFSFGSKTDKPDLKTNLSMFSGGNNGVEKSEVNNTPMFKFGNIDTKSEAPSFNLGSQLESKKDPVFGLERNECNVKNSEKAISLDSYYAKLKGLNQSVAKWISKHVESNPLINLQPIFKDYEKFFEEIEKDKNICTVTSESKKIESTAQKNTGLKANDEKPVINFSFTPKSTESKVESTSSPPKFQFGATNKPKDVSSSDAVPKFSFGGNNTPLSGFSFGATSSAPINFGSVPVSNPPAKIEGNQDDDNYEPPKIDVNQVEEEGHIYTIRCKLFIKKDGNFVEKGVGSLFLKPVPDSEKVQVIVRAHNSLGNVLCNFILSSSIPTQRMGKNNVMVVCIPTPESQPPPIPVLIRVKTGDDADQLLQTLEKHKK